VLCPGCRKKKGRGDREETGVVFYSRAGWQELRGAQLNRAPLCEKCQAAGLVAPATVVDHMVHIVPWRGDLVLAMDPGNLQSLCKPCHDSKTATETWQAGRRD